MISKGEILEKYIEDDESILWSGTPDKKTIWNRYDILLLPVTFLIGGYLIYYAIVTAVFMIRGVAGLFMIFPIIGITFLLIGFYLILGRIWYRAKRHERDIYAVTDKRIIIINTLRIESMVQILPRELYVRQKGNDILLTQTNLAGDIYYNLGLDVFWGNQPERTYGFYGIFDAEHILKIIKEGLIQCQKQKNRL